MKENLSSGRLEFLRDLAVQHPDNVILEGETVVALITRLEQAEQAVARVREVMGKPWGSAITAKHIVRRALDGEPNE
ncbi:MULTISPECIES: hypothetical protein [unclassified Glutamicibacter]|uniref:hypothetical protein n=1 Tax=unclassified Glutamicibacter TaxID=2627139 RepID=UPI00381F8FBC